MAHPAFVDIDDNDIDVDSPLTTDVFQDFRQCDRAVRVALLGFDVSTQTFTSSSYTLLATVYVYIPDLADFDGIQRRLLLECEVKSSGGATATIKTIADSVSSDEPTTTSTSFVSQTITQNFDVALAGTVVAVAIYGKIVSGTGSFKIVDRLTALLEY